MYSFNEFTSIIEKSVKELTLPAKPELLYAPIEYTMFSGGKRMRPLITLASCYMYSDEINAAINAAMAIEVFHNFTLLHDDIMDKADLRRGRETVHKKWNDNVAILSGDAMVIYAYKLLANSDSSKLKKMIEVFNTVALSVCEGQQYDMDFETTEDVTIEQYMSMIELKTSVMIAGAAKLGAIAGGADDNDAKNIYKFGISLGLAFQLQDDILDTYGDPNTFGKNIGGDIASNKKTFLLITALDKCNNKAEFKSLLENEKISRDEKFIAVKNVYDNLGVRGLAESKVTELYDNAMSILANIKVAEQRKGPIREITKMLIKREK